MLEKLNESIKNSKNQLGEQVAFKEQLRSQLKNVNDTILNIKGAIVALEYAKSLAEAEQNVAKDAE